MGATTMVRSTSAESGVDLHDEGSARSWQQAGADARHRNARPKLLEGGDAAPHSTSGGSDVVWGDGRRVISEKVTECGPLRLRFRALPAMEGSWEGWASFHAFGSKGPIVGAEGSQGEPEVRYVRSDCE